MIELKHKNLGQPKRVQVSFTEEQWALIDRFRGVLGKEDAEIVRNIVLSWLSEKSIVSSAVKNKTAKGE